MTRATALIIALIAIATGAWLYWDSLDEAPVPPGEAPVDPAADPAADPPSDPATTGQ